MIAVCVTHDRRSYMLVPPARGPDAAARCRHFPAEIRASTAVEFALISPILLLTILFLMSIGYTLFMNLSLDNATQKAARQVRTGYVQGATTGLALNQTQFRTQVICPLLPSMFTCANVIVNMQAVPYGTNYPYEYYAYANSNQSALIVPALDNTQTAYCPGNGSTVNKSYYVYLQVLYPVSIFVAALFSSTITTTYQGKQVFLIMATATFLNEPFAAPASAC